MVEMKKVRTHYFMGRFDLIGYHLGYEFYPIMYKGVSYVVMVTVDLDNILNKTNKYYDNAKVVFTIFEYREQRKIFRGHKGKIIYRKNNVSLVEIDEENAVDICKLSKEEMKIYLPKIMKFLFEEYETYTVQKAEKKQQIAYAEQWDGIVE